MIEKEHVLLILYTTIEICLIVFYDWKKKKNVTDLIYNVWICVIHSLEYNKNIGIYLLIMWEQNRFEVSCYLEHITR